MPSEMRLKWTAIAALAVATAGGMAVTGLRVPLGEAALLAAGALPPALAAARLRRSHEDLAACLTALAQFLLFTCFYTAVTCLVAWAGMPLVDDALVGLDRRLGIRLPELLAWADRHRVVRGVLASAYHTIVPQTILVIGLLGWLGGRRHVERLMTRLMLAAMIALALYAALPAAGPTAGYGMPLDSPGHYLEHFYAYRHGTTHALHLFILEGMITFPSFHAAWAVVLAASFLRWPRLLALFGPLNAAVVASAILVGGHYGVDLLAGVAIGAVAVVLCPTTTSCRGSAAAPRARPGFRGAGRSCR